MRAVLIALLLSATSGAAHADTLFVYDGKKFTSISGGGLARSFTRIHFSMLVPGKLAPNGQVSFCFGGGCR